jgi:pyruvate dehydrogenase (quinone)
VVFNNSSLAMVKLEMLVDGLPSYETDHASVDYSAIARAIGIRAVRAEKPTEVRDALTEGLTSAGPTLVEVVTDSNALSMPPRVTLDQVRGFALGAVKMVLDGGVGSMVQMARSNLRNIPRR